MDRVTVRKISSEQEMKTKTKKQNGNEAAGQLSWEDVRWPWLPGRRSARRVECRRRAERPAA